MIGSLRGRVTGKHAPGVTVECSGVGYEVETPMSTFLELPAVGEDMNMWLASAITGMLMFCSHWF